MIRQPTDPASLSEPPNQPGHIADCDKAIMDDGGTTAEMDRNAI